MGKEEKETETGNGHEGKEKEAEDGSKEKDEKDKTSETEKDTPAEVKGEGSEGKMDSEEDKTKGGAAVPTLLHCVFFSFIFCYSNSASLAAAEEGKDEKMDTSSAPEEKKGAHFVKCLSE